MSDGAGDLSPLKMVVFDWAGTMVDFGCKAPVRAFAKALAEEGILVAEAEIRADMGLAKKDHVRCLLARPVVAKAWASRHGRPADEADVDRVYGRLEPLIGEAAAEAGELIPGAQAVCEALHGAGLKVGSTTGYTRAMMKPVLSRAAEQGYLPDLVTCAGETASGRPAPLMMYRTCVELGVWPMSLVVKVDDAASGIAEGLNAGAWTIGVAASGNGVGLSASELAELSPSDRAARIGASRIALEIVGAHYVIDVVADIVPVLVHIAARVRAGARP